jgi:hypothetical protein
VVSTLYHDVLADLYNVRESWRNSKNLWEFFLVHEKRQEKRGLCIIALFVGAIIGGEMYINAPGMAGALWLAAGLKFAIVVGWLLWRAQKDDDGDEEALPR